MAAAPENESLRKKYADLAACYRLLADERKRLIDDRNFTDFDLGTQLCAHKKLSENTSLAPYDRCGGQSRCTIV